MDYNIFSYVKRMENEYETQSIQVGDNWYHNMRDHLQMIFHLKNGIFYKGENNFLRAFKQIMRPLLRLSYWTEDIEVKDIVFFSESDNGKVASFMFKKYHDEVFVKEHDVDELIDDITESDIDYGGVLVQDGKEMPEVIPLTEIAFCDQTNILGGPVGFKYNFSPDKLRKMSSVGWGNEKNGATISLEELCTLAEAEQSPAGANTKNKTPGKNIEVYIVKGNLPELFLDDSSEEDYHCDQVQVIAFYTKKGGQYDGKEGCILYRKKADEDQLLFHASEKTNGRALGYSDGEAFLHPQVWENFLTIHKMNFLEAGSKVPLITDDPNFTQNNKTDDIENSQVLTVEEGRSVSRLQTISPANVQLLSAGVEEWFNHAQLLGSAFDPILGKEPVSGTTFRGQERTVAQGKGWHDKRKGRRAKFVELIYRKLIIPRIKKEINSGKKFLASLTSDEMRWVVDTLTVKLANERIKDMILSGKKVTPEMQETINSLVRESLVKDGNQKILETLKNEFDDIEFKIGISVAGKQKDLAFLSDKILSIFQAIFANPQAFQSAMQIPALAKSFSDILEFSGMSIANFSSLISSPMMSPQVPSQDVSQPTPSPTPSPIQLTPNEQPA